MYGDFGGVGQNATPNPKASQGLVFNLIKGRGVSLRQEREE